MTRRKQLLIYECTPKKDALYESKVLAEFLKMTNVGLVTIHEIANKTDLLASLEGGADLKGHSFVHIAAHGTDDYELAMSRGFIRPDEFPKSCFRGKVATFSACGLSKKDFMDPFIETTMPKSVIACLLDVDFADTAIFYAYYYYLVFHHNFTASGAFDRVKDELCYGPQKGRVKGDWIYWFE